MRTGLGVAGALLLLVLGCVPSLGTGQSQRLHGPALVRPDDGSGAVIRLDPTVRYQTMTGWEATLGLGLVGSPAFDRFKDELFDLAVNDLGINRLRVEIMSGVENPRDTLGLQRSGQMSFAEWRIARHQIVNDNEDPAVINPDGFHFSLLDLFMDRIVVPMRALAEARGERLHLNVCYVDFGQSAFEHRDHPEEYAEFVLATYLHLRDRYGWVPDSWEVVLEPENARWSGTQIGQALVAAGRRLRAHGFAPRFIAPSSTAAVNALAHFDQMSRVPVVGLYLAELSYHRYRGQVSDATLAALAARAAGMGVGTAMLEHIGSGHEALHRDLTVAGNSAWSQYTLASPSQGDDGGKYYPIDQRDPQNPKLRIGARTKFLRQYFKFVRHGAVRIGTATSRPELDPVAFVNRDGTAVVVVKASGAAEFAIEGLPAGRYGVKYTTAHEYDVDGDGAAIGHGQRVRVRIPAAGVVTVYGTGRS